MKNFVLTHFPKNKKSWKLYAKIFIPIILATTIVAFNGMVDNFMVGHIEQGVTALSAVNSWTNILIGLFTATSAAGSVLLAQYYHFKRYDIVKQIVRFRYIINISGVLLLIVLSVVIPHELISVFLKKPKNYLTDIIATNAYDKAMNNAIQYIEITTIQWALMAFSFEMSSQLREIGHSKIGLITSTIMLIFNITFNSIFMYVLDMGVRGAAIASAFSRLFNFLILPIYMYRKELPILINPLSLFKISKFTLKLFLKKWIYFFSIFTVVFFITFRNFFYDVGYPINSLGIGVGGMAVLGLTGAFMNIFTTTFSALPAMSANFVGSELGKKNLKQAKINSNELKGFNTLMASFLSLLLVVTSFTIPYMNFLSHNKFDSFGKITFDAFKHLEQVKYSTLVIAFYYPIWIWFSTSYRNGNAGGKGSMFAIVDWIVSGPLQISWLSLIVYVIVPNSFYMQNNFWSSYVLFFIFDLFKLVGIEFFYYKYDWLHSLTHSHSYKDKEEKIKNK